MNDIQPRQYIVGKAEDGELVFSLIEGDSKRVLIKGKLPDIEGIVSKTIQSGRTSKDYAYLPRNEDELRNAEPGEFVGKSKLAIYPLDPKEYQTVLDLFDSTSVLRAMPCVG